MIPRIEVLGKRTLSFKPMELLAAKQKTVYKAVLWDESSKHIHVYSHDHLKEEMIVEVEV